MTTRYQLSPSPLGTIFIAADDSCLKTITFDRNEEKIKKTLGICKNASNAIIIKTQQQLQEYFAGKRTEFTLPLRFDGTEFQKQVWQALLTIPYGETRSICHKIKIIYRSLFRRPVNPSFERISTTG